MDALSLIDFLKQHGWTLGLVLFYLFENRANNAKMIESQKEISKTLADALSEMRNEADKNLTIQGQICSNQEKMGQSLQEVYLSMTKLLIKFEDLHYRNCKA